MDVKLPVTQLPFFPEDQIRLISMAIRKNLTSQPSAEVEAYVVLVQNFLRAYGTDPDQKMEKTKLLGALAYISDSDLVGSNNLIPALSNGFLRFKPEQSLNNSQLLDEIVDKFLQGRYRPKCLLYKGEATKEVIDSLYPKLIPPVIIKDVNQKIFIFGSDASGTSKFKESNRPELYRDVPFLEVNPIPTEESLDIYNDIKQLRVYDTYPGYYPDRVGLQGGSGERYQNFINKWAIVFEAKFLTYRVKNAEGRKGVSDVILKMPDFLKYLFLETVEAYFKDRRISINELDEYVVAIAKKAVSILDDLVYADYQERNLKNLREESYPIKSDKYRNLKNDFKKNLYNFCDFGPKRKLREGIIIDKENIRTKLLYAEEIRQVINYLIPNPPPGTVICSFGIGSSLPLYEKDIAVQQILEAVKKETKVIYIKLNLNRCHWVYAKATLVEDTFILDTVDSMQASPWVCRSVKEILERAFEKSSFFRNKQIMIGEARGQEEQKNGDGITCGDRIIRNIFIDIYPQAENPWDSLGVTGDSAPHEIRDVTVYLLESAKKTPEINWKESILRLKNTRESDGRSRLAGSLGKPLIQPSGIKSNASYFDKHRFVLFLMFLFTVFCFISVGFGGTVLFGSDHAVSIASKFFALIPETVSVNLAAGLTFLGGSIAGLISLSVIWQGLKNSVIAAGNCLTRKSISSFVPAPDLASAPRTSQPDPVPSLSGVTDTQPPVLQQPAVLPSGAKNSGPSPQSSWFSCGMD